MTGDTARYAIDVEDVEYLRHGDKPLLARIYRPRGTGPFPLIIDLHGGAWTKKDRTSDAGTDEPLAKSGVVVVALDFRMPPVLYLQGSADVAHPAPHRERFIASYRKAGGRVELHLFEGVGEAFITNDPTSPAAASAIEKIIAFVHREMR